MKLDRRMKFWRPAASDDGNVSLVCIGAGWGEASVQLQGTVYAAGGLKAPGYKVKTGKGCVRPYDLIEMGGRKLLVTSVDDHGVVSDHLTCAQVQIRTCQAAMETGGGITFPGVLTDKWQGYSRDDPQDSVTTRNILVCPEVVSLEVGSVTAVELDGEQVCFHVRQGYELQEHRHEYELERVRES